MKLMGLLLIFVSATVANGAATDTPGMILEAQSTYTSLAREYVDTIDQSDDELKYWRQMILQERFAKRLSKIENVFSTSNFEVLNRVEDFVKKNKIDSLDDSLLMRMAQLHYDRANFDFTSKMAAYESSLTQYQAGKIKEPPQVPSPDYKKTVFYAAMLLQKFSSSPLSDWAHYLLGYCLFEEGKNEKAAQIYERMLRKHPFSKLSVETRWRLAEYYFESQLFAQALGHYKILSDTGNEFSRKALYKQGATFFALSQNNEAAAVFIKLYKLTSKNLYSRDPEVKTLYDESIDYLAYLRAKKVYPELDEETDFLVTMRLAQILRNAQRESEVRQAQFDFVKRRPMSKYSPELMHSAIVSFEADQQRDRAQATRNSLLKALNESSPFWEAHKLDIQATVEARDIFEVNLLKSAEYYSETAREKKSNQEFAAAIGLYRKFILNYPSSPLINQARFELAQLYFESSQFPLAATTFRNLADENDQSTLRDEAAWGYLLSTARVVGISLNPDQEFTFSKNSSGKLNEPEDLRPEEKSFMEATRFYSELLKKGQRRQQVLLRAALLWLSHNHFDRARLLSEEVLRDPKKTSVSRRSLELITLTYDLENKTSLYFASLKRLENLKSTVDPTGVLEILPEYSISNLSAPDIWKALESERNDSFAAAASDLEQYSIQYPRADETPVVMLRSAYNYRRAGQIASSSRLLDRLSSMQPSEQIKMAVLFLQAANELSSIRFESAATQFENLAQKYKRGALPNQAYYSAAVLRQSLKQKAEAAFNYLQFASNTADHESYFQAAKLYGELNNIKNAKIILSRYKSGKFGWNLYIRGLMESALLAKPFTKEAREQLQSSLDDCKNLFQIAKRVESLLTAGSRHSVVACHYIKTLALRNILSSQRVTTPGDVGSVSDKWKNYIAQGEELKSLGDGLWSAEFANDQGQVAESLSARMRNLSSEQSQEFLNYAREAYSRAIEFGGDSTEARTGLQRVQGGSVNQFSMASTMLAPLENPHNIVFRWPQGSGAQRALFDQGLWEEIETQAATQPKTGFNFMLKARALGEMGKWEKARETLGECVETVGDPQCAFSAEVVGGNEKIIETSKELLQRSLNLQSSPQLSLGLAYYEARKGDYKKALNLAQQVVAEDSSIDLAHGLLARIFTNLDYKALAKLTLQEGLRSSTEAEFLESLNGFMAIDMDLKGEIQASVEDLERRGQPSGYTTAFLIAGNLFLGRSEKAQEYLASRNKGSAFHLGLLAEFADSIRTKNYSQADTQVREIDKLSKDYSVANQLLGDYFSILKRDNVAAEDHYTKSNQLGIGGNKARTPAGVERKESQ